VQASFGPFFVREFAAKVLSDMDAVSNESWFHGHISRQTAEGLFLESIIVIYDLTTKQNV
jgi:hypothetical protein